MKMTTMKLSPTALPATGLIHKNESGPVNQVIFATTQLSEDYLIIMSIAAKDTRVVFTIYENNLLAKLLSTVSAHILVLNILDTIQ